MMTSPSKPIFKILRKDGDDSVYRAVPCSCGEPVCKDWHVSPVADLQGVGFSKAQAEAVCRLLNEQIKFYWEATCGVCGTTYASDKPLENSVFCPNCREKKAHCPGVLTFQRKEEQIS